MKKLNKIFMILAYTGIILFVVGIFTLTRSIIIISTISILVGLIGGLATLEEE